MHHHSHSKKSNYTQLLESINALAKAITDFNYSEQRHHDSLVNSFQSLKAQIMHNLRSQMYPDKSNVAPFISFKPLTNSTSSTPILQPQFVIVEDDELSVPKEEEESESESQQLMVQGGEIAVPDSPSEGPHLSVVHLRPTFPRKPSGQDPLYKLAVTASIDPNGVSILRQPKDVAIGDAVSTLVAVDAPIFDTSPYNPGPLNSQSPTTETTPPSYWKTSFAGDHFLIFGQTSDVRSKMDFIHMIEPVRNTLVQPRYALHDIVPISGCFVHPQDLADGWIWFS